MRRAVAVKRVQSANAMYTLCGGCAEGRGSEQHGHRQRVYLYIQMAL